MLRLSNLLPNLTDFLLLSVCTAPIFGKTHTVNWWYMCREPIEMQDGSYCVSSCIIINDNTTLLFMLLYCYSHIIYFPPLICSPTECDEKLLKSTTQQLISMDYHNKVSSTVLFLWSTFEQDCYHSFIDDGQYLTSYEVFCSLLTPNHVLFFFLSLLQQIYLHLICWIVRAQSSRDKIPESIFCCSRSIEIKL